MWLNTFSTGQTDFEKNKLKNSLTSVSLNVIRHRHKNFDPASVPGKDKNKIEKRMKAFINQNSDIKF
jgi:hypothetical protein